MKSVDEVFMLQALVLARLAEGMTRPNPPVGAVLVKNGEIVADGFHARAGFDHAERACLKKVADGEDLSDATLYVTLEPCCTHGKTPPCTDIILEKGVGRVVVSVVDLNPDHAGRGLKILEDAGVVVETGVCEQEGRDLIAPFEKFITQRIPYLTLKLASTLDGKIADRNGDSKWITGAEAREVVQQMRRSADAILVGAGTVRADDPSLLPRPAEGREPLRVILGKNIPENSKVLIDDASDRTLLWDGNLADLMDELASRNVMHILCEGGGEVAAQLIDQNLVDEFAFFVAPKIIGPDGRPNIGGKGRLMSEIKNLRFTSVAQLGNDILMRAKVVA